MAPKKKEPYPSPKINNRRARFDYTIEDEWEAGIVLVGTEVKSLRKGEANINEAYASVDGEELWLHNAYIAEFIGGNQFNHATRRSRKLLLHRNEINKLMGKVKAKGYTIVPLSIYFNKRGMAKVKIGLAGGKKQHEKRDSIKDREWERDKERVMKNQWQA